MAFLIILFYIFASKRLSNTNTYLILLTGIPLLYFPLPNLVLPVLDPAGIISPTGRKSSGLYL